MAQYMSVKNRYEGMLLFYRMGDFYELFLDDAEIASEAMGIALTYRGQIQGKDIPMCGVPVHAVDSYLAKLIKQGHKVAICEQSETADAYRAKGGKGPLPRDVVRVITAGTLQEEGLLDAHQHNFLASIGRVAEQFAVAWTDMSTGAFMVQNCAQNEILTIFNRLGISEFIYPDDLAEFVQTFDLETVATSQAASAFDYRRCETILLEQYKMATLEGLGQFTPAMIVAAGGLLGYLHVTQCAHMPYLLGLSPVSSDDFLDIDLATRKSLELTRTLSGEKRGSLLSAVDKTRTAAGARLLHQRLSAPLADKEVIEKRLGLAGWCLDHTMLMGEMRDILAKIPDIERAFSRLVAGRGGPRDLNALAQGLAEARRLSLLILKSPAAVNNADMIALAECAQEPAHLADHILPALADELPIITRDGGFIRKGYEQRLDEIRNMRDESKRLIAGLQHKYGSEANITSLKIKHNYVLGYHIEVRPNHATKLMQDHNFIHRQTTAQAVRFTTTELADMEQKMSTAATRAIAVELEIFDALLAKLAEQKEAISHAGAALAQIDVAWSTALMAERYHYVCPELSTNTALIIEGGRHPVVEQMLTMPSDFIANDCVMGEQGNLWLLTGPNMAGKSTFLRQNAHIVIMAQAGLYVPAKTARIGMVDKLFSRVGASDDLARGQSTFMVEMVETAAILNQATARSLVILDEIGRGTATWDGLSIAWGCLEYLHETIGCRALFATHYHELTQLKDRLARLSLHACQVKEWQGDIVFLHQVANGTADKSYGIHVARLAGLPASVIARAKQLLEDFEHKAEDQKQRVQNLPLFETNIAQHETEKGGGDAHGHGAKHAPAILNMIEKMEPDSMTPKQALEFLYQIKAEHG